MLLMVLPKRRVHRALFQGRRSYWCVAGKMGCTLRHLVAYTSPSSSLDSGSWYVVRPRFGLIRTYIFPPVGAFLALAPMRSQYPNNRLPGCKIPVAAMAEEN